MSDVTIANYGDMFCIPCGKGFTCLGFDVCQERTTKLAIWLNRPELQPSAPRGTLASYAEYQTAIDTAYGFCEASNTRCPVELTPQLIGLEGCRVEVIDEYNPKPRRFIVGKSTGWMPCHLEIFRRNASGGPAAMGPYKSIRVIEYGAR